MNRILTIILFASIFVTSNLNSSHIMLQPYKYHQNVVKACNHIKDLLNKEDQQIKNSLSLEMQPMIYILETIKNNHIKIGQSIPPEIKSNYNNLSKVAKKLISQIINQANILSSNKNINEKFSNESIEFLNQAIKILTVDGHIPTIKKVSEDLKTNLQTLPLRTTLLQKMQYHVFNALSLTEKYIKHGINYIISKIKSL